MPAHTPLRVAIVGGGVAAAELLLALQALAQERVAVEVIAPDSRLVLRAGSPGAPFGAAHVPTYDLASLAEDVGATFRRAKVEAVAPRAHRLRLASGAVAGYDAAVIAIGARPTSGVPGAVMFRDARDAHHVRGIADALAAGELDRIAFAVPVGVAWTLPLYELALLAARGGSVAIATPERRPLEVFGPGVSDALEGLLADREVRTVSRVRPLRASHGRLQLRDGGDIEADRTITIPRLMGRTLAGIPADWNGFIHTDPWGRIEHVPDVFAVGDVTDFPVKQGGIATQQADAIAAALAARAGAPVDMRPPERVLRTRLLGADGPLYLRADLDRRGRLVGAATTGDEPAWWPPAKVFGRYLSPWMATTSMRERDAEPHHN